VTSQSSCFGGGSCGASSSTSSRSSCLPTTTFLPSLLLLRRIFRDVEFSAPGWRSSSAAAPGDPQFRRWSRSIRPRKCSFHQRDCIFPRSHIDTRIDSSVRICRSCTHFHNEGRFFQTGRDTFRLPGRTSHCHHRSRTCSNNSVRKYQASNLFHIVVRATRWNICTFQSRDRSRESSDNRISSRMQLRRSLSDKCFRKMHRRSRLCIYTSR